MFVCMFVIEVAMVTNLSSPSTTETQTCGPEDSKRVENM